MDSNGSAANYGCSPGYGVIGTSVRRAGPPPHRKRSFSCVEPAAGRQRDIGGYEAVFESSAVINSKTSVSLSRMTQRSGVADWVALQARSLVVTVFAYLLCCGPAAAAYIQGVNETNLAWQPNPGAVLDEMAAHGVRNVRASLVEPFERSLSAMRDARQHNVRIWLEVALGPAAYYAPGSPVRSAMGRTNNVRGLCHIDPQRFGAVFGPLLSRIEQTGVTLLGIEIGNEINWAGFNGDLPVEAIGHGRRLGAAALVAPSCLADGLRNYVSLLATVRQLLQASPRYHSVPLVAAGLAYAKSDFTVHSGMDYVEPGDFLHRLRELNADHYVDGYAVHFYPGISTPDSARRAFVAALAPCIGSGKGCWVTEWGVAAPADACALTEPRQHMVAILAEVLDDAQRQGALRGAFWFDWCCNALAVYRCGQVAPGLGKVLGLHSGREPQ
jgi:hypothetical protein